jgi:hypothetical protein
METKQDYEAFTRKVLDEWAQKIDDLGVRGQREPEPGKLKQLDFLRKKRQEAQARFESLSKAGEEEWKSHAEELQKLFDDMQAAFEQSETAVK